MVRFITLLVALLIVAAPSFAQERIDVRFDVGTDGSVVQTNMFFFGSPVNGSLNYTLSGSVRGISVSDGVAPINFTSNRNGNDYIIDIFLHNPSDKIVVQYTADDMIYRLDSVEQFFTEFTFDQPVNMTVVFRLPVGYTLYGNSFKPEGGEIFSDGQSIMIRWNFEDDSGLFSVRFRKPGSSMWVGAIIMIAAAMIFIFLYFRQRKKEDFLFGFRHDEKIVINYIQEKKVILQRDLEEQFKFSRAKSTRIVSRLVEKGLVKKQRYGRTNKITWIK